MDPQATSLMAHALLFLHKALPALKFAASFVFVFGIVVLFHEFGHFLAARLFGVTVQEFALGMGPRIFGWKSGGTDYRVCLFPIGGYVKMSGEEPQEASGKTLSEKDYYGQPPFKRFLITFAGPLMNIVLCLLIYISIYMIGVDDYAPVIGPLERGSPAESAGLLPGDTVLSADGKNIRSFSDIIDAVDRSAGSVALDVKRGEEVMKFHVPIVLEPAQNIFGEEVENKTIGAGLYIEPVISEVVDHTTASFLHLQPKDRITAINGTKVAFWQDISRILNEDASAESLPEFAAWEKSWNAIHTYKDKAPHTKIVWLSYERAGKEHRRAAVLQAAPQKSLLPIKEKEGTEQKKEYLWLIGFKIPDISQTFRYSPVEAAFRGAREFADKAAFIGKVFGMLFTGRLGKEAFGGPIMIGKMINDTSKIGFVYLLSLTALLSLNLAIFNYLPFPALDGGHMLFSLIEMLRRKPLSLKAMEYIQRTGFAILILMVIYVSYLDVLRLAGGGS